MTADLVKEFYNSVSKFKIVEKRRFILVYFFHTYIWTKNVYNDFNLSLKVLYEIIFNLQIS